MSEIERIINEVDSSMSMEGLPLTKADKEQYKDKHSKNVQRKA